LETAISKFAPWILLRTALDCLPRRFWEQLKSPEERPAWARATFALAEGSAVIDLFLLIGFLLGVWMVPRFGRIRMQGIGFAGMAAGMLILLTSVGLTNSNLHIPLVFAGFILFNLLMNAGQPRLRSRQYCSRRNCAEQQVVSQPPLQNSAQRWAFSFCQF
jgi:hypothetical protein